MITEFIVIKFPFWVKIWYENRERGKSVKTQMYWIAKYNTHYGEGHKKIKKENLRMLVFWLGYSFDGMGDI